MSEGAAVPLLGRRNPRLAELRRIVRGQHPQLTVVDGVKLVADILLRGVPAQAVYTTRAHLAAVLSLLERTESPGTPVFLLDDDTASHLAPSQHGQGVLAVVARPSTPIGPGPVVLYLHRVQDPGNVGAVIRSAAALGACAVACSAGCADPFSPRAIRAAAGQSLLFPVQADATLPPLADAVEAEGGQVVGTSAAGGMPLPLWTPRLPVLLVFGNEGSGLPPNVAARCSLAVSIPLLRGVESLNVAVSAALFLAHLARVAPSPILEPWHGGGNDPSS